MAHPTVRLVDNNSLQQAQLCLFPLLAHRRCRGVSLSPWPCSWLCFLQSQQSDIYCASYLNNSLNISNSLAIFDQYTNHRPEPLRPRKASRTPHASN
jgi:hypothetical protein